MASNPTAALALLACAATVVIGSATRGEVVPRTESVVGGLTFPVYATHAPGDASRLYIAEKPGVIRIFNMDKGTMNPEPFIDLSDRVWDGVTWQAEQGLHGLVFHPDFAVNGYFYVTYGGQPTHETYLDRYTASDPDTADPATRVELLAVERPLAAHNGGWMDFGPNDGYLYLASGDGECCGDPGNHGQDITDELRGKMLRLDVDAVDKGNYGIPPDNPFVGVEGDDEIWAYGLRNPWRCSFDRANGDLYIADVGEATKEEINYQPAASAGGENYGWRCREGNLEYIFDAECAQRTLTPPIVSYSHTAGRCVIGGYVYRGGAAPDLAGNYFFADNRTGRMWSFDDPGSVHIVERTNQVSPSIEGLTVDQVSSFGEDDRGEIYVVKQGMEATEGRIFRIIGCEHADFDCGGTVEFGDLLRLLATWGSCNSCLEDMDGDGGVNFGDILIVLGRWG